MLIPVRLVAGGVLFIARPGRNGAGWHRARVPWRGSLKGEKGPLQRCGQRDRLHLFQAQAMPFIVSHEKECRLHAHPRRRRDASSSFPRAIADILFARLGVQIGQVGACGGQFGAAFLHDFKVDFMIPGGGRDP